jgi:hypothetical protein
MAAHVANSVIDDRLASLKSAAQHVYVTNAEPTTYTEASSTFALDVKDFGAGNVFPGAIAPAVNGRKVTTDAPPLLASRSVAQASCYPAWDAGHDRGQVLGRDLAPPLVREERRLTP